MRCSPMRVSVNFSFFCKDFLDLFKEIVSRDFVIFLYHSIDTVVHKHMERVRLLLKLRFRVEFFDFHI
jgi:hypothetical protein